MIDASIDLYLKFFDDLESNTVTFTEQNEANATYTCRRIPEDGKINWSDSSANIYNLIRAVAFPYPGAFCYFNNVKFLISKARIGDLNSKIYSGRIAGRVIRIDDDGAEILCGTGTIKILEWKNTDSESVTNPNEDIKSITVTIK
jgi:methionyl-tRNA formyltransferase